MGKETEIRTTMLWPFLLVLLDHNRMVWKIPTYTWQCSSSQTRPPASEESGLRGQTEQAEMEARWRARIPQLSHGELKSQREDSLAQGQTPKPNCSPKPRGSRATPVTSRDWVLPLAPWVRPLCSSPAAVTQVYKLRGFLSHADTSHPAACLPRPGPAPPSAGV